MRAELLIVADRQLERGALQMIEQNLQIVRIDVRVFGRALEEIFGMLDDVLIERRARSHQHGQRCGLPAPRAAGPLPGGRDGPRIAGHHHGIQRADVDAQLQRIGRHHRAEFAVAQLAFDLAPFLGQIAAAVAAHTSRQLRIEIILQIRQQNLGRQAAVGEHQRLLAAVEQLPRDAPRLVQISAADAQRAVHHRRVVKHHEFLTRRRTVVVHQVERQTRKRFRQLLRIGDGRRAANELRRRSVKFANAFQAPQQIRQMAAVHAAIGVQLIDHDIAQILESLGPLGVVRQNARVQHVGIGQHHVGPLPDRPAGVLRSVAVVGERADAGAHASSAACNSWS